MSESSALSVVFVPIDQLRELIRTEIRSAMAEFSPQAAMADESRQVLDYAASAKYCSLSESSIRRAVKDGQLRPIRTGCRAVRFARAELERWLNASNGGPK